MKPHLEARTPIDRQLRTMDEARLNDSEWSRVLDDWKLEPGIDPRTAAEQIARERHRRHLVSDTAPAGGVTTSQPVALAEALSHMSAAHARAHPAVIAWREHRDPTQLEHVANMLTNELDWTVRQARIFLETDGTPLVNPIRAQVHWRSGFRRTRIELQIDPDALPAEVAAAYVLARKVWAPAIARARRPDDRSLRMAAAAAVSERTSWAGVVADWNREHPDDTATVRSFRQAATRVGQRLGGTFSFG